MGKRVGGFRRRTRHKLQKSIREKGKISVTRYLQKLEVGQRVLLKAEPAVHGGMYHPRFHAKTGIVKGKRGSCYIVEIDDQGKHKELIVHPVHLRVA